MGAKFEIFGKKSNEVGKKLKNQQKSPTFSPSVGSGKSLSVPEDNPVPFQIAVFLRLEDFGFVDTAAFEDGPAASFVAPDTGNQDPVDSQFPAFGQNQTEHLGCVSLAPLAGCHRVADEAVA